MKPTFAQLRRYLTHPEVKELIELYNKLYGAYNPRTLNRVWQRNYGVLSDLLHDLDYKGLFRFNQLKQFIKSFQEEEHNTPTKQQDDELFKRIAQQKQQHRQKKEQRKMYK